MSFHLTTYVPGTSCVHRLDARVKLVLLGVYSIALIIIDSWAALAITAALLAMCWALSRISPVGALKLAIPVYVIVGISIIVNSFLFVGTFVFTSAGFLRGLFFGIRILLLVFAVFLVCFSTTATDVTRALTSFFAPLRALRVPVDDVVMVLSLTLRFMPLVAEEFIQVRDAQWARGASFYEGTFGMRAKAWTATLLPVLAGMFRRADRLAYALDARCYGAVPSRTSLHDKRIGAASLAVLVGGLALCAGLVLLSAL